MRPLLLLEINEVPWRLVDVAVGEFAATRDFFARAQTYTTISDDTGELSPWVTWPSLHRGMNNLAHGIKNLGQDVSTFKGIPIWQEFVARGQSIGVCGSLQSWPPIEPGTGGFYIPDTFAHDSKTIPADLEPLQDLNLGLVRKNGLVARRLDLLSRETLRALPVLARRISPKTMARIAAQLASERIWPHRKARRAIFQTLLFWDVFRSLFNPQEPPAFSTFFTNHVAGVMHRFWSHVFPEDFPAPENRTHAPTMTFALRVLDEILAQALAWQRANPELIVVFAASMGQEAIQREKVGRTASVTDVARLLARFHVADFEPLLAMVPQVAVEIADGEMRSALKVALEKCRTKNGVALFSVDGIARSLSISLRLLRAPDLDAGGFADANGGWISWHDAGISIDPFDEGTGYHQPHGVLAVVGNGIAPDLGRRDIPLTDVKALLLDLAELAPAQRHTA